MTGRLEHSERESGDLDAGPGDRVALAGAADWGLRGGAELTPRGLLALQASAGNRAARRVVARQQKRDTADAVGSYMDQDDWARAAWALGQLSASDMAARIEAMTARERRYVISGARFSEPAPWVASIVTAMMNIDQRSAIVGSLHWARFMHQWGRAHDWFHGLSLEDGRKVAEDLGYGADEIAQVMGTSQYLKKMWPAASPGHFEMAWPSMSGGTAASPEEQAALRATVATRNALPIRAVFGRKRPFGGKEQAGYQYAAVGLGTVPTGASRLPRLALAEFYALEGGVSAVVTYDTTLSLGPGFADALALEWVRDWFNHDPSAQRAFEAAGMTVSPGGKGWVVVDDSDPPKVLRGEEARQFIRNSPRLLSLYADIAESAEHTAKASEVQISAINRKIAGILPALRTEMEGWRDDGVVAAVLHMMWWLPVGGPSGSPGRFLGTNGDPFAVARAFAFGLASSSVDGLWPAGPRATSARVIGATGKTAGVITHYYDRFGAGGGNRGVLRRAVEAGATAVTTSVNAALADPALDDHVLLVAAGDTGSPPGRDETVRMYDLGRWRAAAATGAAPATSGAAAAPARH